MKEPLKILLVEDEEIIALVAQSALKKAGYGICHCSDAQEALAVAEKETFALLIADVNLPGPLDGVSLARTLKQKFPTLPVILTSGRYDGTQTVHDEFDALLLPKPFRKSELIEKVRQVFLPAA